MDLAASRIVQRVQTTFTIYAFVPNVGKGRHNNCIVGNGHQNYKIINVDMYSGNLKKNDEGEDICTLIDN